MNKQQKYKLGESEQSPVPVTWVAVPQAAMENDDEISLIDLWLVLVRRRFLVLAVMAAAATAGLAAAFLLPPKYEFTTTVRIGQVPVSLSEGEEKNIDSPETVLANVQGSYLPQAQAELLARSARDQSLPRVTSEIQQGSTLLVLKTEASEDRASDCLELLENVTRRLVADHRRTTENVGAQLSAQLERARIKLEELHDPLVFTVQQNELKRRIKEAEAELAEARSQEQLTLARLSRLVDKKALLENQIQELTEAIQLARQNRSKAAAGTVEAAQAMTVLLIDNEIRENQIVLNRLQNELEIELNNERDTLTRELEDVRNEQESKAARLTELHSELAKLEIDRTRQQQDQQQVVNELEARLANLRKTEVVLPPTKSPNPVGPGKALILALALLAGLMLGVVAAFLAEFSAKARLQMQGG